MGGLINSEKREAFLRLDTTLKECTKEIAAADASGNQMLKALAVAEATQAIREQLTEPMMASVMSLMNSPLGFRTDKDGKDKFNKDTKQWEPMKTYTPAQVRDPLIVAMLRGFRPVGNEFNIIAGNFYATREGMERVIRDFDGLTDLRLTPGVPSSSGGGALVEYTASWRLYGVSDSIACMGPTATDKSDTRIPIRVNAAMGIDAILGKAKAKMLRRIYERLTGSEQGVVDEITDAIESESIDEQPTAEDNDLQASQIIEQAIESINSSTDPELIRRTRRSTLEHLSVLGDNGEAVSTAVEARLSELTPKQKGKPKQGELV